MSKLVVRPPASVTTYTVQFAGPNGASREYIAEACLPLGSDYVFIDSRGIEIGRVPKLEVVSITTG